MSEPRQHHFVSAGYLKAWATGARRTLYAFDVDTGRWLPNQKPSEVAKARDFYRVDAPGIEPSEIEVGFLGNLEAKALPVIADIIEHRFPIARDRIGLLVMFVALAHVRTWGQRDRVQAWADRALRLVAPKLWPDPKPSMRFGRPPRRTA